MVSELQGERYGDVAGGIARLLVWKLSLLRNGDVDRRFHVVLFREIALVDCQREPPPRVNVEQRLTYGDITERLHKRKLHLPLAESEAHGIADLITKTSELFSCDVRDDVSVRTV